MSSGTEFVAMKELKAGMKNVNAVLIVLEVGVATLTKEGREVRTARVADASASVNLSVWGPAGALLQPGDIVRLVRGYASLWRGALTLYAGKCGDVHKVGEFCMLFNEQLNMSEPAPPAPQPAATAAGPDRSNGAPTADRDLKPPHKTYVRGRGPHRANTRR